MLRDIYNMKKYINGTDIDEKVGNFKFIKV